MSIVEYYGDSSPRGIIRHWERKTKSDCAYEILRCWKRIEELKKTLAQQQEAGPVDEDEMFDWIYAQAKRSLRRHNSTARGQQVTRGDSADAHFIWAALKWAELHPPKPAAQPQVPEGMIRVSIDLLDALDNKVRACNRTEHHHAKEILAEEAVEALDYLLSAAKEET